MTTPAVHSHHSRHHVTRRGAVVGITFTIIMVALLGFSTHLIAREISFIMVACIVIAVAGSYFLLPGSLFFTLALANIIAVYASMYVIILDSDFHTIPQIEQWLGFVVPLAAFFAGTLLRRKHILRIVNTHDEPNPADYAHAVLILLPLVMVAAIAMAFSDLNYGPERLANIFLAAMGTTAAIVFFASKDVAIFLLVTGKLFESFFRRMAEMVAPIFAFFTFYSFTVLLFAAVYSGIDRVTGDNHFRILGQLREITFPEAIYFSLVTLATVGYGDIIPASNLMRLLSSFEVICGVMLLLFGFNEILNHAREQQSKKKNGHD